MKEIERPSSRNFRVALLGAGKMAMHHAKAIQLQGSATLVSAADPVLAGGESPPLLDKGVRIFSSAEELLAESKPDVVHVCTPPETHAELAILAIRHGAHVYVEKPFALSSHEAENVISQAKEKGVTVCAGHQLLFETPTIQAEKCLNMLGRIVHIESYFSFKPVRRSRDGRTAISPLDQLVDILPHPVYLLLHFLKKDAFRGEAPIQICALDVKTSGNVNGILRCGDITGNLIVTLEGRPIESYVKIVGTNGSLYADFIRGALISLPGPGISAITKILNPYKQSSQIVSGTTRALFRRAFTKQKSYPGLVEIIHDFYDNLRNSSNPERNYSSIIETVAICEEVGKKLKISEGEEYSLAEKEIRRLESELSPPDVGRGGVLITGGTGLLGKAVAAELRRKNWYARVASRKLPSFVDRIPGVDYVAVDLAENIQPEVLHGISFVIHCAAETAGGKEAHIRNSVQSTRNVLEAMSRAGVKNMVHISSIAVVKTSREIGGPVSEDTPLALDNEDRGPYVWGKAESERLARELGKTLGINIRVIRPGPLVDYMAFEPPGRLGREIGSLFVYFGNRTNKLSLCNIQTAADVIRKYVEDFDLMPPTLNLVEPDSPTRGELVSRLLLGRPDLKALRVPFGFLLVLSPALKLLQRLMLPGKKPVDIYAAFSSERYKFDLAAKIIDISKYDKNRSSILL